MQRFLLIGKSSYVPIAYTTAYVCESLYFIIDVI